MKVMTVLIY